MDSYHLYGQHTFDFILWLYSIKQGHCIVGKLCRPVIVKAFSSGSPSESLDHLVKEKGL